MRKTLKQILACVAAAACIVSAFGLAACKSNQSEIPKESEKIYLDLEYKKSNDGKSYLVTGCADEDGDVSIPDTWEGLPVSAVSDSAFFQKKIVNVIIGDNVTTIGECAFAGCAKLKKVTLGKQVTTIEEDSFNSSGIKEIELPNSLATIGRRAFAYCTNLTSIDIPRSVTKIVEGMFYNCDSLIHVGIPDSVTDIGVDAFGQCGSMTSVVIPDSVADIGRWAFSGCDKLIILCEAESKPSGWDESWNSSQCPVIWNCKENNADERGYVYVVVDELRYGLKSSEAILVGQSSELSGSITVPSEITYNGNSYRVEIKSYAFSLCVDVTSVELPDRVTHIEDKLFWGCSSLTSIEIPINVKSIGDGAFGICSSLTSITLPNNVTSIGYEAFYGCSGLKSVEIPSGVEEIAMGAFRNCSGLTTVKIPYGVKCIGGGAFSNCSGLKSVEIPSSVEEIDMDAFSNCSGLNKIYIPVTVKYMGLLAFGDCDNLTIYCQAASKPREWDLGWSGNCQVVWGSDNIGGDTSDTGSDKRMEWENNAFLKMLPYPTFGVCSTIDTSKQSSDVGDYKGWVGAAFTGATLSNARSYANTVASKGFSTRATTTDVTEAYSYIAYNSSQTYMIAIGYSSNQFTVTVYKL